MNIISCKHYNITNILVQIFIKNVTVPAGKQEGLIEIPLFLQYTRLLLIPSHSICVVIDKNN